MKAKDLETAIVSSLSARLLLDSIDETKLNEFQAAQLMNAKTGIEQALKALGVESPIKLPELER